MPLMHYLYLQNSQNKGNLQKELPQKLTVKFSPICIIGLLNQIRYKQLIYKNYKDIHIKIYSICIGYLVCTEKHARVLRGDIARL